MPLVCASLQISSDSAPQLCCQCRAWISLMIAGKIKKILGKSPEWLVTRWSRIAATFKEENNDYPPFNVFSNFITREADIACDPVTGYIGSRASSERNQKSLIRGTGLQSCVRGPKMCHV